MVVNPNFYLALVLGSILFLGSAKLFKKFHCIRTQHIFVIICILLALISLSIPSAYLSDLIGANPYYAGFRSFPFAELLVVLAAPLAGAFSAVLAAKKTQSISKRLIYRVSLVGTLLYISLPFIKPLMMPLPNHIIGNQWVDGVALQTTPSTCGPSSMATILNHYGVKDTEANIAKQVFSSLTGTENWYLARYAHSQGFQYQFLHEPELKKVPTPSIIGVKLGRAGHYITLLDHKNGTYLIADSLSGLQQMTLEEFNRKYLYDGFVLHIKLSK